jgi:hypothetical protein
VIATAGLMVRFSDFWAVRCVGEVLSVAVIVTLQGLHEAPGVPVIELPEMLSPVGKPVAEKEYGATPPVTVSKLAPAAV